MALYYTCYNLFVVIRSLLSHNEFLHSTLGVLRSLFLFYCLFLLAHTTTSTPTGSDFILLLFFHILQYLVKLGQKNSPCGKIFIAKPFVDKESSIA